MERLEHEEFGGAPSWGALLVATLLILAMGGPLLHSTVAAPAHPPAAYVAISGNP